MWSASVHGAVGWFDGGIGCSFAVAGVFHQSHWFDLKILKFGHLKVNACNFFRPFVQFDDFARISPIWRPSFQMGGEEPPSWTDGKEEVNMRLNYFKTCLFEEGIQNFCRSKSQESIINRMQHTSAPCCVVATHCTYMFQTFIISLPKLPFTAPQGHEAFLVVWLQQRWITGCGKETVKTWWFQKVIMLHLVIIDITWPNLDPMIAPKYGFVAFWGFSQRFHSFRSISLQGPTTSTFECEVSWIDVPEHR